MLYKYLSSLTCIHITILKTSKIAQLSVHVSLTMYIVSNSVHISVKHVKLSSAKRMCEMCNFSLSNIISWDLVK